MKNTLLCCKEKLENNGLKITPQRLKIFCCLVNSDSHPTAEFIYKKVRKDFPNISFDTVNRTLISLVDKSIARIIEGGYGARHFDANLKHHYHFRCIRCKRIIDFECPEYDNIDIPKDIRDKFMVTKQEIVLEGICPECLEKIKENKIKEVHNGN